VPEDLGTIVLKCLRKEIGDRYGTAEALGQDLRRFVRRDPIEAKPEGSWERIRRQLVRKGRQIAASVLILCLVVTCSALLYWLVVAQRALEEVTRNTLDFGAQFAEVVRVEGVNSSDYGDCAPVPSADGCELFFGSECLGGLGRQDIWMVWRPDPQGPWGTPRNLKELNSGSIERPTWISPDGLRLYYTAEDEIRCAIRESKSRRRAGRPSVLRASKRPM
jgi:hypothetical protein